MDKIDLIIDTSTELLRLILSSQSICESFKGESHVKFQEHLLPEVERLLSKNKIELKDIDTFCVVAGPGSFTGVRLGVTMVKAFCLAYNTKKIISINMLDLLIDKVSKDYKGDFLVVIKCTSSKCYVGEYIKGQINYKVLTNEEILNSQDIKVFSLGKLNFESSNFSEITLDDNDYISFVKNKKKNKEYIDFVALEPIYMALSQAEEELLKKENNG